MNTTDQSSTNPTPGFTGETQTNPKHEAAIVAIKASQAKQGGAILDTALLVAKTWERYTGLQQTLASRVGMSKSELSKYVAIGQCKLFYTATVRPTLPHGLSLLYTLSQVEHLDEAIQHNRINPDMTRTQCEDLRKIFNRRYLPEEAPPMAPPASSSRASAATSNRFRKYCAMIEFPFKPELSSVVQDRLAALRNEGFVVHDYWTDQKAKLAAVVAANAPADVPAVGDAPSVTVFPQSEVQPEASILTMLEDAQTEVTEEVETDA